MGKLSWENCHGKIVMGKLSWENCQVGKLSSAGQIFISSFLFSFRSGLLSFCFFALTEFGSPSPAVLRFP
jgi:hypothetical protein